MDENEEFFVSESIAHARTMPLTDCIRFLRGFSTAIGDKSPASIQLRAISAGLVANDAQLELIQMGQLKLNLDHAGPRRPGRRGNQ